MRVHPAAIATCVLILLLTTRSHADDGLLQDLQRLERLQDAVEMDADHVEYLETERKVVAKGNVRIGLGERSLFADEVSVDLDDQVLVATGHVILMEGLNRLEGDRIEYNYRTNLGVVTHGRASLLPGISFSGTEIRREGERTYRVQDGRFTACRLCQPEPQTPDWELRAREATVYLNEWVTARDASMWVRGLPTLFSPVAAIPIGPRRTGFLIPRFGYGNVDGFVVKQPFFWAISRSQDLTLLPIYRTKRGLDLNGDYRYILSEDSRGELIARYLYDITPSAPERNRAEFKWWHDQVLSPTWTFKAFVQAQTDRTIQRAFTDSPVVERTQATLPSNAFITQATPQYMLLGLLNYTRDLSTTSTETDTGRLPDIRFQWLPGPLLDTPLLVEGETSAVYLTRNKGEDTGRVDFQPGLHLPVALAPWLTASSLAAFRGTAYTENEQSGGLSGRVLVDLGERLTSRFARRFDQPGLGLLRLTHIVEPSVAYQYIPWWNQQSLPQFDSADFISPQNRVTYQLRNRLIARWREAGGEIRTHEVATLDILQSWNLMPRTREFSDVFLTGLTPERVDQAVENVVPLGNGFSRARERELSNLVFDAKLSPIPGLTLRGTLALNTQERRTDAINTGVEVRLPDRVTLELATTYARDQQANGIVGRMEWRATKAILLDLLTRYDVATSSLLETGAGIRYSSCCWEVGLKYTYRSRGPTEKPENSVHVTFDLKFPSATAGRSEPWKFDQVTGPE